LALGSGAAAALLLLLLLLLLLPSSFACWSLLQIAAKTASW
jgi:hypothetical protein